MLKTEYREADVNEQYMCSHHSLRYILHIKKKNTIEKQQEEVLFTKLDRGKLSSDLGGKPEKPVSPIRSRSVASTFGSTSIPQTEEPTLDWGFLRVNLFSIVFFCGWPSFRGLQLYSREWLCTLIAIFSLLENSRGRGFQRKTFVAMDAELKM